jgi:hypothetical protein
MEFVFLFVLLFIGFRGLGLLAIFVAPVSPSVYMTIPYLCVFYHNFNFIRLSLVLGVYIAVVNMSWVAQ